MLLSRCGARAAEARKRGSFTSILELSRRAELPPGALTRLAESDAFRSLNVSRREAAWAIKSLRSDRLSLFEAADLREATIRPDLKEPAVELPAMTGGREVVEDYRSHGLTLRSLSCAMS